MQVRRPASLPRDERGTTLMEILIALVVLSIGVLAVAQLFPAGSRTQVQNRQMSSANYYVQQTFEELRSLGWSDASMSVGRHPAGTAVDSLGSTKTLRRFYNVDILPAPLDNLKRVVVTMTWNKVNATRSLRDTLYMRK